jgi:hypothetical protein
MSFIIMLFHDSVSHIAENHIWKKWLDVSILLHNNSRIEIIEVLSEIDEGWEFFSTLYYPVSEVTSTPYDAQAFWFLFAIKQLNVHIVSSEP